MTNRLTHTQFAGSKVLLLSPHTDDCEIGMGSTICRMVREGAEVHWHVFSNAAISLPPGYGSETLLKEQRAAAKILGVPQENLVFHDFPVRNFPQCRQAILDVLVRVRRTLQPDFIFCPASQDSHQDHSTLNQEAMRAFRAQSLLGYLLPWNSRADTRQLTIEVTADDVEKRSMAMASYKSQEGRPYFSKDFIRSSSVYWGAAIGKPHAEVFEVCSLTWSL